YRPAVDRPRIVYRYALASNESVDAALLEVVWEGYLPRTLAGPYFRPPVDVVETDDAIEVTVEVPGVPEEQILVRVRDGVLVIAGERPWPPPRGDAHVHRSEIRYGNFRVAIQLPGDVRFEQPRAVADRGLVRIELPKARGAR